MKHVPCIEVGRIRRLPSFEKHLRENQRELDEFFGMRHPLPLIILLESRKQIDAYWDEKTPRWVVGWTRGNAIFLLRSDRYAKESVFHTMKDYWQVVKHEQVHIYEHDFVHGDIPRWCSEGLACFLAGQKNRKPTKKELCLALKEFNIHDGRVYHVGLFIVQNLLRRFGRKKMLLLLTMFRQKSTSSTLAFRKVYGKQWNRPFLEGMIEE